MLKLAISRFITRWHGDYIQNSSFLMPVHDEGLFQTEKENAPEFVKLLKSTMEEVGQEFHPTVPCAVDGVICNTWADAKA